MKRTISIEVTMQQFMDILFVLKSEHLRAKNYDEETWAKEVQALYDALFEFLRGVAVKDLVS